MVMCLTDQFYENVPASSASDLTDCGGLIAQQFCCSKSERFKTLNRYIREPMKIHNTRMHGSKTPKRQAAAKKNCGWENLTYVFNDIYFFVFRKITPR